MFRNKIIIVIALVTVLFLGTVFVIMFLRGISPDSQLPTESPTLSTIVPEAPVEEGITYNKDASDELLRIVGNRPASSESDSTIRQSLISSIGNATGVLYSSDQIAIEYVLAPDSFQVEIKTVDVSTAKEEAISWFASQGLTEQGICYLPVFFYLNFEASQSLKNTEYTFNPLPEFCL